MLTSLPNNSSPGAGPDVPRMEGDISKATGLTILVVYHYLTCNSVGVSSWSPIMLICAKEASVTSVRDFEKLFVNERFNDDGRTTDKGSRKREFTVPVVDFARTAQITRTVLELFKFVDGLSGHQ